MHAAIPAAASSCNKLLARLARQVLHRHQITQDQQLRWSQPSQLATSTCKCAMLRLSLLSIRIFTNNLSPSHAAYAIHHRSEHRPVSSLNLVWRVCLSIGAIAQISTCLSQAFEGGQSSWHSPVLSPAIPCSLGRPACSASI